MKTYYKIFILSFLIGCSKDKLPEQKILFTDLNPEICISYNTANCNLNYKLDLNKDGIDDFVIKAALNSVWGYNSWHDGYTFYILGLDSNRLIRSTPVYQYPYLREFLDANYPVTDTCSTYTNQAGFLVKIWLGPSEELQTESSKFIGVSVKKNTQFYNGWIKFDWSIADTTVVIKSYAIMKSPSASILTGQTNKF